MLTSETKRRIDSCRDILVGKLPLPSDQVELITLALIYKFMDDLDEESVRIGGRRSFFVDKLKTYRWRALIKPSLAADVRMNLFAEGIETLGGSRANGKDPAKHLPQLFRDIFRNEFLKFRDGRTLTLFLNGINGFSYDHSEELGNAFEYLLQCMGTQGENGQFRTPRHIIDFMVACIDPQPTDRILDPACGTGGFLVSSFKHILKKHTSRGSTFPGDQLNGDQRQRLYQNLAGYDITDLMVKLSKVNLFLHGFPDPAIHIYDTLSNDARWNDKADVILANPPFMTPKGGVTPHAKFRVAAKKAEVLFTDYIAEHLSPDGRGAVIVPNGIVATPQNAYVQLRRYLIEDSLVAVVSLPAGVFKPYSGVKTSILFLDKSLARRTKEILFVKVTADGFDLGDQRRPIAENDLPDAENVVKKWMKGKIKSDFESPLRWAVIQRYDLLDHRSCTLQAETFLGDSGEEHSVEVVRLADIVEINPKKSEVRGINPQTTVSFLPMEDLNADGPVFRASKERPIGEVLTGYTYFRDGDVLIAKITPCFENGKAGIAAGLTSGIGFGSTEFYVLRASEKVLPEYVYYHLTRPRFREEGAQNMAGTAGQQRVRRDFIENYEIPLPPLEEQRRIVEEIEGYQKIIDAARQILANSYPRFEIDREWPVAQLGELVSFASGGTPTKSNQKYWMGKIPWISAKDMKCTRLIDGALHISESAVRESATRIAPMGSILILVRGMGLANGVPICELAVPCAFNQDIRAAIPKPDVDSAFLAAALRQEQAQFKAIIRTAAHGTLKIEFPDLQEIRIPLPPLKEQRRIVAELDAEAAQIEAVRALIPSNEIKIQRVLDRVWGKANE